MEILFCLETFIFGQTKILWDLGVTITNQQDMQDGIVKPLIADTQIEPTYKNSIKFSEWILKRKINNPNFQDALRVHYILEAILKSSKYKKIFFLNN